MAMAVNIFQSPYFWFFFSALFLGAGLSRATRRIKQSGNPEKTRNSKWIWVCIYLTLAVLLALGGVIFPDVNLLKNFTLLLFFGVVFVSCFLALRFKKAIGIPTIFLLTSLGLFFAIWLQTVVAFTGETRIGEVKVLSAKDKQLKLEVNVKEKDDRVKTEIINLKGEYFAPIVKLIIFDDLYVFLGAKTWYRFVAIDSYHQEGEKFKQSDTNYYFPKPTGISEWVYQFFEQYQDYIPGVKSVKVDMGLTRVKESQTIDLKVFDVYGIWVQNDGGVEVIKEKITEKSRN